MQSALETAKNRDHKSAGPKPAGPSPSAPASFNPILTLQQQAGNQAVQELLRHAGIQAKLSISDPGDPEEREADQVAERIMRSHAADVSSSCSCSENEEQCGECKQKQSSTVSRKGANALQMQSATPQSAAFAGPQAADSAAELSLLGSDGGHPLDPQSRAFFESRFNHDFSKVRLHTGGEAAESARSIQALAYTTGNHIAFAASQYQPSTEQGQKLLAHELTHVVQQRGASNKLERIADSSHAVESTDRTNSSRKSSGRAPAGGDAITQPAIQRKVANVNCPANAAGAPADPRKDLEGADVKAVELTKQMAADLATDAETVKGGIPAVPSLSLQSFENHFGLPIAQGKGFLNRLTGQVRPTQEIALSEELSLVSRRFNLVLRLLGQGLSYICPGNHTVSLVGCAPGACPVGDSFSCPGNSLVGLCETFWTSTDETGRAQMIVHEGFHIVFPGVLDATTRGPGRNFNIDGCYEALLEDRTGSQTSTCPDPPNQAPPAPGNQGAQAPQNPAVQPKLASSGSGNVLRKGAGTDSQEMESADQVSAAVSMLHGDNGQPLDGSARAFFEPRFGHDFSDVRVHTSGQAARSAESIQALAYTATGNHIVFGASQYQPSTERGQRLLAHELAHVVQQQGSARESRKTSDSARPLRIFRQPPPPTSPTGSSPSTPSRIVFLDNDVVGEIADGNKAAAEKLLELQASGADIRIARATFNEALRGDAQRAAARRLIIEQLGVKVDDGAGIISRMTAYETFAEKGIHVQIKDLPMIAAAKAAGAEIWSLDGGVRTNVKHFGVKLMPGGWVSKLRPLGVRVGLDNVGLHDFTIAKDGTVIREIAPMTPPARTVSGEINLPKSGPRGPSGAGFAEGTSKDVLAGEGKIISTAGKLGRGLTTVAKIAGPFVDAILMLQSYKSVAIDASAFPKLSAEVLQPIVDKQVSARSAEITKIAAEDPDAVWGVYANVNCELHYGFESDARGGSLGTLRLYEMRFLDMSFSAHDVNTAAWDAERGRKEGEGVQQVTMSIRVYMPPPIAPLLPEQPEPTDPLYFSGGGHASPLGPQPITTDQLLKWAREHYPRLFDDPGLAKNILSSNEFAGSRMAREKALNDLRDRIQEEQSHR